MSFSVCINIIKCMHPAVLTLDFKQKKKNLASHVQLNAKVHSLRYFHNVRMKTCEISTE